jgi:DNA-binding SARP family transcriptional activator
MIGSGASHLMGQGPLRPVDGAYLHLLGGFRLLYRDKEISARPRDQRLLALLAIKGVSLRHLVAGTLWPEVTDNQALSGLRTALWRLNGMPTALVVAKNGTLALHPTISIDVENVYAILDRMNRGDHKLLGLLLEIPGELLPGWYDDWVLFERARLQQVWFCSVELAAMSCLASGDHLSALQAAFALLGADPFRESAHRLLIQIHMAEGNNVEALRQLQDCQVLLADQQVPPSRQLLRLFAALRAFPQSAAT